MALTANMHEARTHLSRLVARVAMGEQVVIARAGKPMARLAPIAEKPPKRVPGLDKGKTWIAPDFDAPLPDAPGRCIPDRLSRYAIGSLGIELTHVSRLGELPMLHGDAFDRMLIAQSQVEKLPVVTADPLIA